MHVEYKFPRSSVFLMLLTLVTLIMAIEAARRVSVGDSAGPLSLSGILGLLGAAILAMAIAGTIGFAILRFLRRSGSR